MSLFCYASDELDQLEEFALSLGPTQNLQSTRGRRRGRGSVEVGKSSIGRRMRLPRWKRELYIYEMNTESKKKRERELAQQQAADAKRFEHLAAKQ